MEKSSQIVPKLVEPDLVEMQMKLLGVSNKDLTFPKSNDFEEFKNIYSPTNQLAVISNRSACFFGHYPTLDQINMHYNSYVAQDWLIDQLVDFNCYSIELEPMDSNQLETLSFMIVDKFGYLKVTELLLFFYEMKSGTYGNFFGKMTPMRIMEFLHSFVEVTRKEANEKRFKDAEDLYYKEREQYVSYQPERLKRIEDALSQRQPKKKHRTENKVDSTVFASINSFLSNAYGLTDVEKKEYEEAFKKNHGCSIQEYIKRNDKKEE